MKELNNESVQLVVTSPPYFDLKDYENESQIGFGSSTYEEYLRNLNEVWHECIRVLVLGGKICINVITILLSGNATKFKNRVTKTIKSHIHNFIDTTERLYNNSILI